jgi:hypothetical protein
VAELRLEGVSKTYPSGLVAVKTTTRPAGWIVARLPADSSITEAQRLGVTVAANSLHLFDPATGATWARMRAGAAEPELPSSAPAGQGSDRAD